MYSRNRLHIANTGKIVCVSFIEWAMSSISYNGLNMGNKHNQYMCVNNLGISLALAVYSLLE